jgi:hypothetical protein
MEGVFASAWSHDEEILVGPGGGIWGLEIGELRARDPGLCGDRVQVEPDRIRVEIEGKARLFDRQAQPLGTESCEESVADEAEPCTIETDGGSWKLGWDGLALWLPR